MVSSWLKKEHLPKANKLHTYLAVKLNSASVLYFLSDKIYLGRTYQNWALIFLCENRSGWLPHHQTGQTSPLYHLPCSVLIVGLNA